MNKIFFFLSLYIGKFTYSLIRFLNLGQGSNLPGKISLLITKNFLNGFELNNSCKIVFITGTNGKSTTCGLTAEMLKTASYKVIYNEAGANLLSGVATTLCIHSNLLGKIKCDYLILEIDEATLPIITNYLSPEIIAVTNLFRDQLDRFGELDTTAKLIEKGINNSDSFLILNADDARVAYLNFKNPSKKKIYFGLNEDSEAEIIINDSKNWEADPEERTSCPVCKSNLYYEKKIMAHFGVYLCPNCKLQRPEINFLVANFKTDNVSVNFNLIFREQRLMLGGRNNFFTSLIGIFNLYNLACAIAIAKSIANITNVQIQKALLTYKTIFGRGEKINIKNKCAWVYLIKNPSGTTEVLKTLTQIPNSRFLIAINDNFADGRDISWLWDARFEILSRVKKNIFISGHRASDMALRLKYAGISSDKIKIIGNLQEAISHAIEATDQMETLYILPTYTALLEINRKINKNVTIII